MAPSIIHKTLNKSERVTTSVSQQINMETYSKLSDNDEFPMQTVLLEKCELAVGYLGRNLKKRRTWE
jgi:hypothetical protein